MADEAASPCQPTSAFTINVSNLSDLTNKSDIKPLFRAFGELCECSVKNNCAVVRMEDEFQGRIAIEALDGCLLNGQRMKCEEAAIKTLGITTKLFIGNLSHLTTVDNVKDLFQAYGYVVECDIVRNYSFVHVQLFVDVRDVLRKLNGTFLNGRPMKVQISKSLIRPLPGMDTPMQCARCRNKEHWTRECPNLETDEVINCSLLNTVRVSYGPFGIAQRNIYLIKAEAFEYKNKHPEDNTSAIFNPWIKVSRMIQEYPEVESTPYGEFDVTPTGIHLRGNPPPNSLYPPWMNFARSLGLDQKRRWIYKTQEEK